MKKYLRPSGGHNLDIPSLELPDNILSLARNVHTRKGFPSRIGGRRACYTVDAGSAPTDPMHLLNFPLNNLNWWLLFSNQNIYAVEGSNFYDVSIASQLTIADPHEWSSTLLNGIPVFSNGKNLPHYWTGDSADDAIVLPGWPANTSCKFIVAFRYHLFALNIDGPSGTFENLIMWSNATEPGAIPDTWTPAASNEAGSTILADTEGRCIAGAALGAQLMIYKPTSMHILEYAGQQPDNIFTVRPAVRSTGLLSPHALSIVKTQHAVVGNDDVVLTDGVNVRSIADNRIKQYLVNSIDETNAQNVFTVYDKNQKELWVCTPEPGNQFATVAHIWDQVRDSWVTRDLINVRYGTTGYVTDQAPSDIWNDDSQPWDADFAPWNGGNTSAKERVVLAQDSMMYVEDTNDNVTVNAVIQRLDLTFDDPDQIKVTTRVYIEGAGLGLSTLFFRLGSRNDTNAPITWGAYSTRQAGGKEYEISGRFISIEISNNTDAEPWTVTRYGIEAEYDGAH